MNIDTLKASFQSAGVLLVRIEGDAISSEDSGKSVLGSLEDYISALKALKAPIVLLYVEELDEGDFSYSSEEDSSENDADEDARNPIDLCSEAPELKAFKTYIGEIGQYRLSANAPEGRLDFYIRENWYRVFLQIWGETIDRIDEARATVRAAADSDEAQKRASLFASLDRLTNDDRFVRLKTQKAMLVYALDQIPGVGDVDRDAVKERIRDIAARIAARKGQTDV